MKIRQRYMIAAAMTVLMGCSQLQSPSSETAGGEPAPEAASAPKAAPPPRSATLPAGTALKVRTITELSTKTVRNGQPFEASLDEPLMDGMWLIASKGATVKGLVSHAEKSGRVKGRASIAVRLATLMTDDGQTIDLSTNIVTFRAKPESKKKNALKVGIASGIGAVVGAIAGGGKGAAIGAGVGAGAGAGGILVTRGPAAVIPSETAVSFELQMPVTITEKQ